MEANKELFLLVRVKSDPAETGPAGPLATAMLQPCMYYVERYVRCFMPSSLLVYLLFAVLLSLHLHTFLMFFVSAPKRRDTVLGTYTSVRPRA